MTDCWRGRKWTGERGWRDREEVVEKGLEKVVEVERKKKVERKRGICLFGIWIFDQFILLYKKIIVVPAVYHSDGGACKSLVGSGRGASGGGGGFCL